jgi:hypothetical protein
MTKSTLLSFSELYRLTRYNKRVVKTEQPHTSCV